MEAIKHPGNTISEGFCQKKFKITTPLPSHFLCLLQERCHSSSNFGGCVAGVVLHSRKSNVLVTSKRASIPDNVEKSKNEDVFLGDNDYRRDAELG